MMSENELVSALRQRDPDAFSLLFEIYSDKIYRLAAGMLEDEVEADGIVQDSFLRLFEKLDTFEGRSKLGTWLYRVAYNLTVERLRKRRPTLSLDESTDEGSCPLPVVMMDWSQLPEKLLSESEIRAELDKAIANLPEKYRIVFILRELEGVSTQETAVITNLSISTVKVRLHRARLFLREKLSESLIAYV
jgi:RNA polymerase sigma-70 factor (ECF subfamily)